MRSFLLRLIPFFLAAAPGCVPQLPQNAKSSDAPQRTVLWETADVSFEQEQGVDDAVWLQVKHASEDATFGGYLSQNQPVRQAIVILLHGASTFEPNGGRGSALTWHHDVGPGFRAQGYLTWSLETAECGSPYGTADLADVRDAVDWLDRQGKTTLGVQRVYVLGYSTGGTLAILLNRERKVDGVVEVSGLTEPYSIQFNQAFWRTAASLYPNNEGACQMLDTLNNYGPPDSPAWEALNTVAHIDELKSPMLAFHETDDPIFSFANLSDLEARYNEMVAAGQSLPLMQFMSLTGQGHFPDIGSPEIMQPVLDFFDQIARASSQ